MLAAFTETETLQIKPGELAPDKYFWRGRTVGWTDSGAWSETWRFQLTLPSFPPPPTLLAPAEGTAFTTALPTLEWQPSPAATSYTAQLATDDTFSQIVLEQQTDQTEFVVPLGKLEAYQTYYWRVNAIGAAGAGNWTLHWTFNLSSPISPTLLSPTDSTVFTTQLPTTLEWQASPDVTSYTVQVAIDEVFSQIVLEQQTDQTAFSISPDMLEGGKTYRWRVNAIGVAGPGDWSLPWTFNFSPETIPPTLFDLWSPSNGDSTGGTPTFMWKASSDNVRLSHYQLWIDGKLFQDNITQRRPRYTVTEAQTLPSGLHTWTVKAVDWAGNTTQANQTWSIRVDGDAPAPFSLIAPDDDSWRADPFPVLTWQASSDAGSGLAEYRLYMNNRLFKSRIAPETTSFGFGDAAFDEDFESGTSKWNLSGLWELTNVLRHGGDFALSSNPKGENYSHTQATTVTLAQNADLRAVGFATLRFWHRYTFGRRESGAVEISKDGGRVWTRLASYGGRRENWTEVSIPLEGYTGSNVLLRLWLNPGSGGPTNGWTIDDIQIVKGDALPEGSHTWYLVAVDGLGNETQSEQTWTFNIDHSPPDVPTLTAPGSDWMTETTPEFRWEPVTDAGIGTVAYQFWLNGELLLDDLSEAQIQLAEENALTNGQHTWFVRAIDTLGNANQSTPGTVRIDLLPPGEFSLGAPKEGEIVNIPTPEFSWNVARDLGVGIDFYQFFLDEQLVLDKHTQTTAFSPTPLNEGKHTWYVKVFDKFGNERQSTETVTFIAEWSPPDKFDLISPADKAVVPSPRPTLTWEASSDAGSGIAKYQLWIGGQLNRDNIASDKTATTPAKDLPSGAHNWFIKAIDEVGNTTSSTSTWSFTIEQDTAAPTSTITSPANEEFVGGESWEITGTADDGKGSGVKQVQLSQDGGNTWLDVEPTGEGEAPAELFSAWKYTWTNYTAGEYIWSSRAVDNTGNIGEPSTEVTIHVDLTPPKPSVGVSPNPADGGDITVSISFTVSGGSNGMNLAVPPTVTWTPPAGDPQPVVQTSYSGTSWTGIATLAADEQNGTAIIAVSGAKDKLNNVMLDDASGSFQIDSIPPAEFDLLSPPDKAWANTKRPTLSWNAATETGSGVRYQLTLDDQPGGSTTSTSISPSSDLTLGEHVWTVQAIDGAGNSRLATSRWKFNIDVSKPVTHIVLPRDGGFITGAELTIQGTATDGEGVGVSEVTLVEISIDDGEWQPVQSSGENFSEWTYLWTVSGQEGHKFRTRATDRAGNVGGPSPDTTVTVDISAPVIETVEITPELAKTGEVNLTVTFKTNLSGLDTSKSPEVLFVTADGQSFPFVKISYQNLTWTGVGAIIESMANGEATIQISKATDNDGVEIEPSLDAGRFVIDTQAPTLTNVTVEPDPAKAGVVAVSIDFADLSRLDTTSSPTVEFTPANTPASIPLTQTLYDATAKQWKGTVQIDGGIQEGEAIIRIAGIVDAAGNEMETIDNIGTFLIDVTPPADFALLSPPNEGWTRSIDVVFSWEASADSVSGLSHYQITLDGIVYQDNLPPDTPAYTPEITLLDGEHTWQVVAFDLAGNLIASKEEWRFQIDSASPQSTITVGTPSTTVDGVFQVEGTTPFTIDTDDGGGSGVAQMEYRIDEGDWIPYLSPFTMPLAGHHLISYRSTDKAGNVEDSKTIAVFVETDGVIVETSTPWDVNRDGVVNIFDLVVVSGQFGQTITTPVDPNPDVTGDGIVNIFDLVAVASRFGQIIGGNPPAAPRSP